jgi:hypothetical protein
VILVSGVGPLRTAIAYPIPPTERTLTLMRLLSLASIFAAICSFSVGVATALKHAADASLGGQALVSMTAGLAESFVPPFVALGFLWVAWLLVALGLHREA